MEEIINSNHQIAIVLGFLLALRDKLDVKLF
jgi:hypothetical protein